MKLTEKTIKINLISLLAIILILICVVVIVAVIYSYGEKECMGDPVAYANNHSDNYWWDYVNPVKVDGIG